MRRPGVQMRMSTLDALPPMRPFEAVESISWACSVEKDWDPVAVAI